MQTPKVLLFDIETSPSKGYYFDLWREGNIVWTEEEWYMLCFAYKWLGKKKIRTHALPDFKGYKPGSPDDKALVLELWKLFDEADILIAHNGDRFDIPKANARFAFYKLPPPSPYKTVDTRIEAKRIFKFTSNKLDDLGEYLGYGRKLVHTGSNLWKNCMAGVMKAWAHMIRYNKRDVELLELIYLHMRPWMKTHPSISVISNIPDGCPNCGHQVHKRGLGITRSGIYQRYQCINCKAWSKGSTKKVTNIS